MSDTEEYQIKENEAEEVERLLSEVEFGGPPELAIELDIVLTEVSGAVERDSQPQSDKMSPGLKRIMDGFITQTENFVTARQGQMNFLPVVERVKVLNALHKIRKQVQTLRKLM